MVLHLLLSGFLGCDATRVRPDFDHASALGDLSGRDPDPDERDLIERTWSALVDRRASTLAPPLVRVVTASEHAELVARQAAVTHGHLEEQALRAVGLIGMDAGLAELEGQAAEPVAWLPSLGLLAVRQDVALDAAQLERGLALSLDQGCVRTVPTRDARLAAWAIHEELATATVLDAMLDERLVPLSRVAVDGAVVAEALAEQGSYTGAHPLVAAERAWAREHGASVAFRLHRAGGFRTLAATCASPPAATQALEAPDAWDEDAALAPLAGPSVPAWEAEGWRAAGEERLGRFTLDFWLRQLGPYGVLIEGWQGDAVTVYERDGALRAAWSVQLDSADDAFMLASVLDGRTLRGGQTVATEREHDTLTVLVGGEGEVVLRSGPNPSGGRWVHALREAPDLAAATVGRRTASAPALWDKGLLQLGDRQALLSEVWSRAVDGVAGEIVTLTNRGGRTRVELSLVPRILAGSPRTAVVQGLELAEQQHGISGKRELELRDDGATARLAGEDRFGRPHVLEVHAWQRGDELLYVVAKVQKAAAPKSLEQLLRQVGEM